MKKIILLSGLLLGLLFFVNDISAQKTAIIKGRIIDQATNETMPGVNVVEIDSKGRFVSGTTSDMNGNYILKIKDATDSVQVSFIGYRKQSFAIENQTTINVSLELESTALQEVKITAQKVSNDGITKVRDLGTAVTRMELKDMKSVMSTTVEEMLQGRMGNVDITSVSGDPGAGLNIRIRGTASLNAKNNPLIVVNGIPYAADFDNFDFAGADVQKFGNLIDVSPEDIESIEVLKDAASTAVWGSSAANGVLMIKTKRGIKSKPMFEYTFKNTIAKEPDPIPVLDNGGYAKLMREEVYNYNINSKADPVYPSNYEQISMEPYSINYNAFNFIQNTNWIKEITTIANTQQHDFSVRGGGDKTKYNLSVGYYNETGTVIGNLSQKLNLRSSLDYELSKQLRFNSDIMYTRYDDDMNYDRGSLRSTAYTKMPNLTIFRRDSLGNNTDQYFTDATLQGGSRNPVAVINLGTSTRVRDNARALFNLRYNIMNGLTLNSTITLDIFDSKESSFLPTQAGGSNDGSNNFSKKSSVFTKNQMIYRPKLNQNHDLSIMGQFDTEMTLDRSFGVRTSGSASKDIQQPVGDKNISSISSSLNRYRSLGTYISANYNLFEKYIFMLGVKGEGTSAYSSKSRWGIFPTSSFAWRISNEPFLKNNKALTDLKLRASWGQSGNRAGGNYLYFNTYDSNAGLNYMDIKGTKPSSMELTSLKWETIEQVNLGFDLSLFKDALSVVFDVYSKKTRDLLLQNTSIPITTGFTSLSLNDGEMENRGIELSFNSTIIKTQSFQFDMNVNFSRNQNIVTKLPQNYSIETGNPLKNGEYLMKVVTGKPLGGFFGYNYLGVYRYSADAVATDENGKPILDINGYPLKMQMGNEGAEKYTFTGGDAKYKDINHDGVINKLDVTYLGDLNPKYMGGGGTNLRYKNLSISTFFSFKYGSKIINKTRMNAENMSGFDNQSKATNWRWRQEGNITNMPRALWAGNGSDPYGYNWLGSDRFVEDGSFIRLKTASLVYDFGKKLTEKLKIKELKLYVTGYNLYTWTRYSGQDPDVSPPFSPTSLPVDNNLTPPSIRLLLGINVKF